MCNLWTVYSSVCNVLVEIAESRYLRNHESSQVAKCVLYLYVLSFYEGSLLPAREITLYVYVHVYSVYSLFSRR